MRVYTRKTVFERILTYHVGGSRKLAYELSLLVREFLNRVNEGSII